MIRRLKDFALGVRILGMVIGSIWATRPSRAFAGSIGLVGVFYTLAYAPALFT